LPHRKRSTRKKPGKTRSPRQQDGTFLLIAGERRFKASQMLDLPTIPVRIVSQAGTKADVIT